MLIHNRQKYLFIGIITLILGLMLFLLQELTMPLVLSMLIAYMGQGLLDRMEKRKISRAWGAGLITIGLIVSLILLLILILPPLLDQLKGLIESAPKIVAKIQKTIPSILTYLDQKFATNLSQKFATTQIDYSTIGSSLSDRAWDLMKAFFQNTGSVINTITIYFLTPFFCYYFLKDWKKIWEYAADLVPHQWRDHLYQSVGEIDTSLINFAKGQMLVCAIMGLFYAFSLTVMGLNYGLLIGFLAGLVTFIPFLGAVSGFLAASLVAYSQFGDLSHLIAVISIFGIGQIVEGNFLTPHLVGRKIQIHPIWAIIAMIFFGKIFGFFGLLMALPLAAATKALGKFIKTRILD